MIKGNYSLANEQRKIESGIQARVQKRQKRNHMMAKLESVDPALIRRRILSLEKLKQPLSSKDSQYLKRLREEWKFIRRNKLHVKKVEEILAAEKKQEEERIIAANKLWGKKSVYFNPELNPLGKIPAGMENITIPLKQKFEYPADEGLQDLGVSLPMGEPPKFYKNVQNYDKNVSSLERKESLSTLVPVQLKKKKNNGDKVEAGPSKEQNDFNELSNDEENDDYDIDSQLAPEEEIWNKKQHL